MSNVLHTLVKTKKDPLVSCLDRKSPVVLGEDAECHIVCWIEWEKFREANWEGVGWFKDFWTDDTVFTVFCLDVDSFREPSADREVTRSPCADGKDPKIPCAKGTYHMGKCPRAFVKCTGDHRECKFFPISTSTDDNGPWSPGKTGSVPCHMDHIKNFLEFPV